MPIVTPGASTTSSVDTLVSGEGLKGEAYDRALAVSAVALASGTLRAVSCSLAAGVQIASVIGGATVAGVGMTHGWYLIWDRTLALVAQTADAPASFQATGLIQVALTATYTVPATGVYLLGVLATTGTSMPTMIGSSTGGGAGTASLTTIGSGLRRQGQQAGLSAPPNPLVPADVAASVWLGVL
jgi:hypothetical protein